MAIKFRYCRIQGKELAANTKTGKGIFSMLNQMVTDGTMEEEDVGLFREIDSWFAEELPWPPQCQRQEKVVCYFKTENTQMMMKMINPLFWLLERYKHPYYVIYTILLFLFTMAIRFSYRVIRLLYRSTYALLVP